MLLRKFKHHRLMRIDFSAALPLFDAGG